jgi:L,D-peptidoglycan transpeptidase YkuD (ErfK/YbiS/YcfS/YnhG family)
LAPAAAELRDDRVEKAVERRGRRMSRAPLAGIRVAATAGARTRGLLVAGGLVVPCALGRSGIRRHKREGDGATPAGRWRLVSVLVRSDRLPHPATALPVSPIGPNDGWCDDPRDRRYNRRVDLPFPHSHERLWREDRLYDVVIVLDYNLDMPKPGAGSAIFLHIARDNFAPTEGCVAIAPAAMQRLLAQVGPQTFLTIR